jgi:hypothetical protein
MGISSAHAKNCTVAKIIKVPSIEKVRILRVRGKEEQASLQNRKLCECDTVRVPKSIPSIRLLYSNGSKKTLRRI